MQALLAFQGLAVSLLCAFCFPETAHRLGIDRIREERRAEEGDGVSSKKTRWQRIREDIVILNPLAPLKLLMLPHVLMIVSFALARTISALTLLLAEPQLFLRPHVYICGAGSAIVYRRTTLQHHKHCVSSSRSLLEPLLTYLSCLSESWDAFTSPKGPVTLSPPK